MHFLFPGTCRTYITLDHVLGHKANIYKKNKYSMKYILWPKCDKIRNQLQKDRQEIPTCLKIKARQK